MTDGSSCTSGHAPFDELRALTSDPATAVLVCVCLAEAYRATDPEIALAWAAHGLAIAERTDDAGLELDALRAASCLVPAPSHRLADIVARLERLARRERSAADLLHALLVRRALGQARSSRRSVLRPVESLAPACSLRQQVSDMAARSPLASATASGSAALIADALSRALLEMWLTDLEPGRPRRRASMEAWAAAVGGRRSDPRVDGPPITPSDTEAGSVRSEPFTRPPPSVLWLAQLVLDADRARLERDAAAGARLLDLLWPHRALTGSLGDALGTDTIWLAIGAAAEAAGDLGLAAESYDAATRLRPADTDLFRSVLTSVRHARVQALAA